MVEKIRLSEHVANELKFGELRRDRGDFTDDIYFFSAGRDKILVGDTASWDNSWTITAYYSGLFWWKKKRVCLTRGDEHNLPISDEEHELLFDAYFVAEARWKAFKDIERINREAKRKRMTDWP